MSARPVLGIIACNRTVGTEVAQTVINRYATAAMRYADCAALIIPSLPDHMHAREIVGRLDGVLLTGTPSNVAPALYGDTAAGEGPFDPDRDRMMIELVEATIAAQRPLFGICRAGIRRARLWRGRRFGGSAGRGRFGRRVRRALGLLPLLDAPRRGLAR